MHGLWNLENSQRPKAYSRIFLSSQAKHSTRPSISNNLPYTYAFAPLEMPIGKRLRGWVPKAASISGRESANEVKAKLTEQKTRSVQFWGIRERVQTYEADKHSPWSCNGRTSSLASTLDGKQAFHPWSKQLELLLGEFSLKVERILFCQNVSFPEICSVAKWRTQAGFPGSYVVNPSRSWEQIKDKISIAWWMLEYSIARDRHIPVRSRTHLDFAIQIVSATSSSEEWGLLATFPKWKSIDPRYLWVWLHSSWGVEDRSYIQAGKIYASNLWRIDAIFLIRSEMGSKWKHCHREKIQKEVS